MIPQRQSVQFDLPAGTMLGGKYELMRKIAMGGMAEIYLARTRGTANFEKLVVVKRILPTVAEDENFVRMFLDEARLAATLRHPNIADVYEVGEDDGAPFFAMEFIHGQDARAIRLAAREHKETVPLAIAIAIVHGIASALDYAHAMNGPDGKPLNLVHRDVSASNILVGYEGAIKLIDFGIARSVGRTHQTQVGTLKGKIPYMSPEQCRGNKLDQRSDLFSLGVVMYELTTGRRPFRGENDFVIMDQIVHVGAQPPSQAIRNYPADLEAMVMKLLARKVEDRYQSADALLHDLDPYIAAHRLFVSPKTLSRFMRTTFASRLQGWDDANDEKTRAQHILNTITSRSQKSELLTPPSSFPAVLPSSQEMAAVTPTSGLTLNTALLLEDEAPRAVIDQPSRPSYPEMPSRRGRWLLLISAIVAIGAGAFFGVAIMRSRQDEASATAAGAAKPGLAAPAQVEPTVTEPAATPRGEVQVDPPKPTEEVVQVTADPPNVEPTIEAAAEPVKPVEDDPKVDEPKPGTTAKPRKPIRRPVKHVVKVPPKELAKDPPKDPPPKDPPKDDAKKPPPKDQPAWDKDSPFLPN